LVAAEITVALDLEDALGYASKMQPGPDQDTSQTTPRQRLTVADAAALLGVSQDAIRKRVARNSIEHEKSDDGRIFVFLDPSETREAADQDASKTAFDIMEEQVEYLRRQLEVWQEEARRKDHIIAALTERIPELEAPRSQGDENGPLTSSWAEEKVEEATPDEQKRSWWRRFFDL